MTNQPARPTNSLATASLVFAFLLPPLGIALAALARDEIRTRQEGGGATTVAAFVVGIVLTAAPIYFAVVACAVVVLSYLGLASDFGG